MSTPKKHHYVPQFIIRAFADADGLVWHYNLRETQYGLKRRSAKSVFWEKDLYSIVSKDGRMDPVLEIDFSTLVETPVAKVHQKILGSVRAGHLPCLTAEERGLWCLFFLYQWKRTPSHQERFYTEQPLEALLEDLISEEGAAIPFDPDEVRALLAQPYFVKNVKTNAIRVPPELALDKLQDMGIAFVCITRRTKSFILSNDPVIKLATPQASELGDPDVEIWMPIAHDIAVCPYPGPDRLIADPNDSMLRSLNLAMIAHGDQVISRSDRLLRSLLRL